MRIENDMDDVEGEAVARQGNRNCESTQMAANWDGGGLAAPKRGEAGMTSRSAQRKKDTDRDVFGGTPTTADDPSPLRFDATRTSALPKELESGHGHRCASMGGSAFNGCKSLIFNLTLRKSLIFKIGLTQVVDFHDIFRYFSCFFTKGENTLGGCAFPFGWVSILDRYAHHYTGELPRQGKTYNGDRRRRGHVYCGRGSPIRHRRENFQSGFELDLTTKNTKKHEDKKRATQCKQTSFFLRVTSCSSW
jgi:hypothetical protein